MNKRDIEKKKSKYNCYLMSFNGRTHVIYIFFLNWTIWEKKETFLLVFLSLWGTHWCSCFVFFSIPFWPMFYWAHSVNIYFRLHSFEKCLKQIFRSCSIIERYETLLLSKLTNIESSNLRHIEKGKKQWESFILKEFRNSNNWDYSFH